MAVYPKILLVEGNQEIRVIPELIEKNGVVWKIQHFSYLWETVTTFSKPMFQMLRID